MIWEHPCATGARRSGGGHLAERGFKRDAVADDKAYMREWPLQAFFSGFRVAWRLAVHGPPQGMPKAQSDEQPAMHIPPLLGEAPSLPTLLSACA